MTDPTFAEAYVLDAPNGHRVVRVDGRYSIALGRTGKPAVAFKWNGREYGKVHLRTVPAAVLAAAKEIAANA